MLVQQGLNLHDGDVLASTDDDVLRPAGDPDVSIRINAGQVASVEPALAVNAVQFGTLEVANELAGATRQQPARLTAWLFSAELVNHPHLAMRHGDAIGFE